jgi:acyl carrier protein
MKNDIYEKIKNIIIEKFDIKTNQLTKKLRLKEDLGADSLDLVEFIMDLEKEFNINISDEEADKINTIEDCLIYIKHKTSHHE